MHEQNVIVVGGGPVGCTAALLLADRGVPVTILERYPRPHPLPRAVHLDDEVIRILHRIGVSDAFLAVSRPASGLRLLDAEHGLMAEFRRDTGVTDNGFPGANMFHQPELEALLFHRVDQHPLIDLHRGVEVRAIDGVLDPWTAPPVRVHTRAVADESARTFTGSLVLGCDGANSTVRQLLGVRMQDLRFTERWLVIDVRAAAALDTYDGVEQVCDPARAATFMHVTGDRYRWEFRMYDGEDETDLVADLGRLLQPWTGQPDLAGLEVTRSAVYTFRARLASRFQVGRAFLLGDAAHLTPPFIGQGLAAGIRDADNLAWKIDYVLAGKASPGLLTTYQTERRPHAKAMIRKAKLVGWAMTGGQDAAATVRRVLLAAAVRSDRVREAIASTATPRLRSGALRHTSAWSRPPRSLRVGALLPNPLLNLPNGKQVRLDDVLDGNPAIVTARRPGPDLLALCRKHGISAIRITDDASAEPGDAGPGDAGPGDAGPGDADWVDARLGEGRHSRLSAVTVHPSLTLLVRPDRVIAAVADGSQLPHPPWLPR